MREITQTRYTLPPPARQSGITLIIALIVLVAMSLAGIALVRSVDTGVLIAGNLAFRQGATIAGDSGIEAARAWLLANNNSGLYDDQPGSGYYATGQDKAKDPKIDIDLTGNASPGDISNDVDWDGKGGMSTPHCLASDAAGNAVCYVIHRMCADTGDKTSAKCALQIVSKAGSSMGAKRQADTYQEGKWLDVAEQVFYRVTVRVAGPRNNFSFVQAILLI